jgi:hypothetical protein
MDLVHGNAASAIVAYQSRVSNALNAQHHLIMDCVDQSVPYHVLEALLCNALARYELVPRRIEIIYMARRDDARALRELRWIDDVLAGQARNAEQTGVMFKIDDPTGAFDEVREARGSLSVVIGRFENAPERERELLARLGLPGKRLRTPKESAKLSAALRRKEAEQKTARHRAVGFFSAEMTARFRDRNPHDELVADLLNTVGAYVDKDEVRGCRYAYSRDVR